MKQCVRTPGKKSMAKRVIQPMSPEDNAREIYVRPSVRPCATCARIYLYTYSARKTKERVNDNLIFRIIYPVCTARRRFGGSRPRSTRMIYCYEINYAIFIRKYVVVINYCSIVLETTDGGCSIRARLF